MRTITRRQFIEMAAAAIPSAGISSSIFASATALKPNIVFVFADQMRNCSMGCMGDKQIKTPNLDRLAGEGLLTTNAISVHPVCTPFRGQIMTGRHGFATGIVYNNDPIPAGEKLISEILKEGGYATGYIGKWHLSGKQDRRPTAEHLRGWDYSVVIDGSGNTYRRPLYWINNQSSSVAVNCAWESGEWEPDVYTDLAIEYINSRANATNPFCLFLSLNPPHDPYEAPPKYMNMYKGTDEPDFRLNVPSQMNPSVNDDSITKRRSNYTSYYAMITGIDECVGRIDQALKNKNIADNTVFIFTSDHGDMLYSHGHWKKERIWEESINIPFIARYPGHIPQGKRDILVASIDIMPTLLGFAQQPVPNNVHGQDLSALFCKQSNEERDAVLLINHFQGANGPQTDWRGIRTKEWVYGYHKFGDWVLYNIRHDPYESVNLIGKQAYVSVRNQLRSQLDAMRAAVGDNAPLAGDKPPEPSILPDNIPVGNRYIKTDTASSSRFLIEKQSPRCFRITLSGNQSGSIAVYSAVGTEMKRFDAVSKAVWNCTNKKGAPVPSGKYIIVAGSKTERLSSTVFVE